MSGSEVVNRTSLSVRCETPNRFTSVPSVRMSPSRFGALCQLAPIQSSSSIASHSDPTPRPKSVDEVSMSERPSLSRPPAVRSSEPSELRARSVLMVER